MGLKECDCLVYSVANFSGVKSRTVYLVTFCQIYYICKSKLVSYIERSVVLISMVKNATGIYLADKDCLSELSLRNKFEIWMFGLTLQ